MSTTTANRTTRRRAIAAVLVAVVAGMTTLTLTPAFAAAGFVEGMAYRDFNSNGVYNIGSAVGSGIPNDVPLANVTATAYDRDGVVVDTDLTDAAGVYSVNVTSAASADIRIEFSFSASQIAEGYQSGFHGSGSGTSVQFVQDGDTGVDFAANVPEDFIQNDPTAAVAVHRYGNPETVPGSLEDLASSVTVDWDNNSTSTSATTPHSNYVDTGSLYGLAFEKGTTNLYASAVLRAHTGLGAAGLGGIYLIDSASNASSLFLDLSTAGVDVGQAAFSAALGAGAGTDNDKRGLLADPGLPNHDEVAYPLVGKTGLGGMAISSDQKTLYVVNLFERSLLAITIATKAVVEIPLTLSADERPFGVTVYHGSLYIGVVDTAQTSGARTDLAARVLRAVEPAVVGPVLGFSTALTIADLTFDKGPSSDGGFGTPNWTPVPIGDPDYAAIDNANHWNAWDDDFTNATASLHGPSGVYWTTYSQPILSSMTFDASGNLIMGFLDRFSFQTGMSQYSPDTLDLTNYSGISSGGVYGAAPSGVNTFTLESNGSLGSATGGGVGNNRGPGGGQFYVSQASAHSNAFLGAVASMPGFSNFLSTGYDLTGAWVSDAGWVPSSGTTYSLAQRVIRNSVGDNGPDPDSESTLGFGKAGGLGGIAILAALAPVEIGNRVWYDADGDGLQDADEPGLPDVDVTLYAANGTTVLGTTTTAADGTYYFSNIDPDTTYIVEFDYTGADITAIPAVFRITSTTQLEFTPENAGGTTASNDSDADETTGRTTVALGGAGENDHRIDAGVLAINTLRIEKAVTGTSPAGTPFTVGFTCRDFRGDSLVSASAALGSGTFTTLTLPAGSECDVEETDDAGAISTTYAVDGGAASAIAVTALAVVGDPTVVTITNAFPVVVPVIPPPLLALTGFVNSWMMPVAVAIILAGLAAILVSRRRRAARA